MKLRKVTQVATASVCALALSFTAVEVANATPVVNADSASVAVIESITVNMSAQEWRNLADKAERAGDLHSAIAASKMAQHLENGGNSLIEERGVASWVKKMAIAVLKYEAHRLPKWIRPYATKIAYALESIEGVAELPLAAALMKMGVDGGTAAQMAHYIVLFVSTFGPI